MVSVSMREYRHILDEIVWIVSAILTVAAALSLLFSIASFFAGRRPLVAEADVFSLRGARLASQIGLRFQARLFEATKTLDPNARESLVREWAQVGNVLQAEGSLLILRISNRGSRPINNLSIVIEFIPQFKDIAIDTNARPVIDALSKATLASYDPQADRLVVQTLPRLPAHTQVTVTVWGSFDLPPDVSTTIGSDEHGSVQPALATRVTGIRAKILKNAHWLTISLALFLMYEALTFVDKRRGTLHKASSE